MNRPGTSVTSASLLLAPLAVLAFSSGAAAAERDLTLDEALVLASKNNATLQSARAGADVASASVGLAWAALLPQLSLQGKYTHNYREVTVPGGQDLIQPLEQLDGTVSLTVPLIVPPVYPALRAAQSSRASAEAEFAAAREAILFSTAQTFFLAAGADEIVAARDSAIRVAQKTLEDARARVTAGAANDVEAQRAEVALLRAEQALDGARYARDQSYRALATILSLRVPFRVRPPPPPVAGSSNDKGDVLAALTLRPELASLEHALRANRSQVSSAKLAWAPTLSGFGVASAHNHPGFTGDNHFWAAGLQLEWRLYDGGTRDAQRRISAAQVRDGEARLRLERDTVADEVADGEHALATLRRALVTANRSAELVRQTLDLVRVQYGAGTATQLDLLTAQDSLAFSEVAAAQARFDLALARLALDRVTGRLYKPNRLE